MKKKFLITILSLVCLLVCSFALAACGGTPDKPSDGAHTHKYVWTDNGDGTHDGHCAVSGCDRPDVKNESHVWGANDKCTKCGSAKDGGEVNPPAHSHSWSKAWANDETHHWHECTASGCPIADNAQKDGYGAHSYNASTHKCVCGKRDPNTPTEGLEYALNDDNESYYVKGIGTATDTDIVIASEFDGKPVTAIGENAFKNNNKLTGITVPSGVTAIGQDAFLDCTALATIRYTGDIKSWCEIDELHNLMEHGAAKKLIIDGKEIKGELIIPDGVTSIADAAFGYCTALTGVKLPDSLTYIGNAAFASCTSLTSVEIPDSLKTIGGGVFGYCLSLTSLTLPAQLETIGDYVFMGCHALSIYCEKTEKPESWQENWDIYEWNVYTQRGKHCPVIWDCKNNDADKDGYVYSVIDGIRYSLKDSVASVVNQPANLTVANIPASVTYKDSSYTVANFASSVFSRCTALESITVDGSFENYSSQDGILYNKEKTEFVLIPRALKGAVTIPDGITNIGSFYGRSELTSITIPDSVTSIGSNAFGDCDKLQYNEYDNAYYLGNESNKHLALIMVKDDSVTSYAIPESTKIIADGVFYSCESLENITAAENSAYFAVQDGILYNKDKTEIVCVPKAIKGAITVADGITSIEQNVFIDRTSITSITVPDSVTGIDINAFNGCNSLESITLPFVGKSTESYQSHFGYIFGATSSYYNSEYVPSSLKTVIITGSSTVDDHAFSGCDSLTKIIIHDSVTSIGSNAFEGCDSLESITLPFVGASKNGTENTHFGYIFGSAYYNIPGDNSGVPESLKTVIITGGERIAKGAFKDCNLINMTLPFIGASINGTENTHFGYIFDADDCYNQVNDVPTSLKTVTVSGGIIDEYAFYRCQYLTKIKIADEIKTIGRNAFGDCDNLQYNEYGNAYYLGNDTNEFLWLIKTKDTSITSCAVHENTKYICYDAFRNCGELESVTLPSGITRIEEGVFANCSSLMNLTIPNGVKSIEKDAFDGCSSLTELIIPDSVTSMGYAFYDCDNLQYNEYGNACYLGNSDNNYLWLIKAKDTSITSCTIHESTKYIYHAAFYACASLTSITIPDGIESVGDSAFAGCGITNLAIPKSLTHIGEEAFAGCGSLTGITVEAGNENYHSSGNCLIETASKTLLLGCNNSVIPDDGSVTSIGDAAFGLCGFLTGITIPNKVTSIGNSAFAGCTSLSNVTLENGLSTIGKYAFESCTELTSITIPNSVSSIGYNAFCDCNSLTNITYNGTVAQWRAATQETICNSAEIEFTVTCTDGTLDKDGNEINQ